MKKLENKSSVNAYLIDAFDEDKNLIKSVIIIPYHPDSTGKSLRVTDEYNSTYFYTSTRLGALNTLEDAYEVDVTGIENLAGKRYELREIGTAKLLQEGRITVKAADAKVFDLSKTGT